MQPLRFFLSILLCAISILCMNADKRALVIGLGRYADSSWPEINGDNDIEPICRMLKSNGFEDIRELRNEFATFKAIRHELMMLALKSQPSDIVYIHFSGHGQRMSDIDRDELTDNRDECWIPYDAMRSPGPDYKGEFHITDDLLNNMLTPIAEAVGSGGAVIVVADACHSGDSTRERNTAGKPRDCVRGVYDDFVIARSADVKIHHRLYDDEKWLLVSACLDYQLNCEYNGMGRLSYIITNDWPLLRQLGNKDLISHLNRRMNSGDLRRNVPQNPTTNGMDIEFRRIFK